MTQTTEQMAAKPESPPDADVVETERREREAPETDALPEAGPDDDTLLADEQVEDLGSANPAERETDRTPEIIAQRGQLAQRIRNSRKLPKGLRDRLAEVVETLQLSDDAETVPALPVAEAVEMIEAAIPENLQFHEGPLETPAHPRGEGFFTGGASQLSSEDAERIAKEQLAATGFGAT